MCSSPRRQPLAQRHPLAAEAHRMDYAQGEPAALRLDHHLLGLRMAHRDRDLHQGRLAVGQALQRGARVQLAGAGHDHRLHRGIRQRLLQIDAPAPVPVVRRELGGRLGAPPHQEVARLLGQRRRVPHPHHPMPDHADLHRPQPTQRSGDLSPTRQAVLSKLRR